MSILNQVENLINRGNDALDTVNNTVGAITGGVLGDGRTGAAGFDEWRAQLDSAPRPNRFQAVITYPSKLPTIDAPNVETVNSDARRANIFVDAVQFPGKNIRTVTNETVYGPTYEMAQGLTYAEEISMTFFMRNDHKERLYFNTWQDLIIEPKTYDANYYRDYVSTMDVFQLDVAGNKTAGIRIVEVFPKTVGALDYNNETTNAILKFNVGFAFKEWIPLRQQGESWVPYENYIEERMFDARPVRRRGMFEDLGRTFNKVIEARNKVVGIQQKAVALQNFFKGITKNPLGNLGIRF